MGTCSPMRGGSRATPCRQSPSPGPFTEADLLFAVSLAEKLERAIGILRRVIDQTDRRSQGEKVSASEKVVSFFEEHTDIIVSGRRAIRSMATRCFFPGGTSTMILDRMIERATPPTAICMGGCLIDMPIPLAVCPGRLRSMAALLPGTTCPMQKITVSDAVCEKSAGHCHGDGQERLGLQDAAQLPGRH